jgi:peptidoglycan-N-acetylglucosamine deacetylase
MTMMPRVKAFQMTTSWDDGHPLDLCIAELLEKHGFAGTFYVPRRGQMQVMHPDQIRQLSGSFEIGAHTLEHVLIDKLSDTEARRQLAGSRQWIEDLTGKGCRVFCFPGGHFRRRQLRLVREAGFHAARTVELLSTEFPRPVAGVFLIPTTAQVFSHRPLAYARNSIKRFSSKYFGVPRALLHARDWVTLARGLLVRTIERGGVFHLWGHSWEIEQEKQWKQLDAFLAFAKSCGRAAPGVSNGELCKGAGHQVPV